MKLFPEKPKIEHRCPCGGVLEHIPHTVNRAPYWECDKCNARFKPAQELVCVQVQKEEDGVVFPLGLMAERYFEETEP